jgi:hypothetical protein
VDLVIHDSVGSSAGDKEEDEEDEEEEEEEEDPTLPSLCLVYASPPLLPPLARDRDSRLKMANGSSSL